MFKFPANDRFFFFYWQLKQVATAGVCLWVQEATLDIVQRPMLSHDDA